MEARALLKESGLRIDTAETMDEAARVAVEALNTE